MEDVGSAASPVTCMDIIVPPPNMENNECVLAFLAVFNPFLAGEPLVLFAPFALLAL